MFNQNKIKSLLEKINWLSDSFEKNKPDSIQEIRDAVVEGGLRRVRPAMMTTATTILALIPVLTATGRGADIMLPMAILLVIEALASGMVQNRISFALESMID